jgi:signal transduction histidine kinase
MGLGLFLARNVIQRLGGRLDFQSKEGLGTVVTVILPESQHPSGETTHGL